MTESLALFLDIATEAALAGGATLMKYWGKLDAVVQKGRPGDLVTAADRAAEDVILATLCRHFPGHAILAEESGQKGDRSSRYLWTIDPLDGTTNFAHQYPFFATSIALLVEGIPQVGVVFAPYTNELFRAALGLGSTRNREPIGVSATTKLEDSLLVTGFAYDRRETPDNNYAEFCHLTHETQGVRRGGAASLDLCYVACGRLDGYWERGLSAWDVAAGVVVTNEAGGRVTAYDNSSFDLFSGRILASNGKIHDRLSRELCRVRPLKGWSLQ